MTELGFSATSEHTLDAKNRIFIPMKFRENLGETIYVLRQRTSDGNCLRLYTKEEFMIKAEKYNNLEADALEVEDLDKATKTARRFFAFIDDNQVDSKGRMTLKPSQLAHAGIDKEAIIIGIGNQVEIWSKANWEAYMGL